MPRPAYPSDEQRRKQRPHAKVHLSIRSHPRYGEALEDPEARGIVVGLWVLAVQYHAAQTGDEVALGLGDLVWLTGRAQRAHALGALRAVCERMNYALREDGKRVIVQVRNLQRKQGFDSASRGAATRNSAPSEEQKNQGTEEQKNREEDGASGAASSDPTPDGNAQSKKPRAVPSPPPPGAQRCAEVLRDELDRREVSYQRTNGFVTRWAREIERMPREYPDIEHAESPWDMIEAGIRFAFSDGYFGTRFALVIRSASKLRERWPNLVEAARKARNEAQPSEDLEAFGREYVARGLG